MSIGINAAFDGGNIRVVAIEGDRVDLEIVPDHQSDFYQWFYFRVAGARGRPLSFRILNAGGSAYPFAWPGYRVRASTDRVVWRQTPTTYADGVLHVSIARRSAPQPRRRAGARAPHEGRGLCGRAAREQRTALRLARRGRHGNVSLGHGQQSARF